MTYVDLYLRLSDGRDLSSLAAREKALRREAAKRGWEVYRDRVVIENDLATDRSRNASAFKRRIITLPDGTKAMRTVRPGFRSILEDLIGGHVQAVLVEDFDRLARDHRDGEDLLDVVEMHKATVDALSADSLRLTNGGTDDERDRVRDYIRHANKSSRDTSRRVRAARERQRDEAIWPGGRRPFGFIPVAHPDGKYRNTVLEIDPTEAAELRNMADKVLSGVPMAAIALDLNERSVPTVTGVAWTAKALTHILRKPLNAGITTHQREEVSRLPGEPILVEDVWRAVVAKLNAPTVTWTDRNGKTREAKRGGNSSAPRWLGTNIYLCPCDETMAMSSGVGRTPIYRCSLRVKPPGTVHAKRDAEALDSYIGALVVARMSRPDAAELITPAAPAGIDVNALRAEVGLLRQRLEDLGAAFAEGEIPMPAFKAANSRIAFRLNRAEHALASQAERSPLAPLVNADDVAARWAELSLGSRRAIVKQLMTVRILPTRTRAFDPSCIEVTWK